MGTDSGNIFGWLQEFCDQYGDPRTTYLPLMSSPWPTIFIVAFYLFSVKYLLPKLMKNRKPYKLKKTLIYYNAIQILMSVCALEEAFAVGFFTKHSWRCEPIDTSSSPITKRLVAGMWLWYVSKFIEFLDTIFFVMRKKDNQVSKLHLFHHSIMPINSWVTVKFVPGGHAIFGGVINSFVHLVMYSYYLLSALGPGMKKYLWWKRYVTTLQMGQFMLIFIHMMQTLFIDCGFPRVYAYFVIFNAVNFLIMFKNFYSSAYDKQVSSINDSHNTVQCDSGSPQENSQMRKRASKIE